MSTSSLKYRVWDLIQAAKDGEVDVIAHQANCQNVMASGIAPQIKRAFPEAWEADNATKKGDKTKLGRFTSNTITRAYTTERGIDIPKVYNLYGQYGYGRTGVDTDYEALRSSMALMSLDLKIDQKVRRFSQEGFKFKVGLPKIGAGLGGGDWEIIEKIIEEELTANGHDVTIYVLDENEVPEGRNIV